MSKNIEININTNGSAYEPLYPKTLASNISAGTFTGNFTFGSVPSCSVNPSGTNHLVRKGWIDSQGYATQSWVNGQGYVLSSQIGNYVVKQVALVKFISTGSSVTITMPFTNPLCCHIFSAEYSIPGNTRAAGWYGFAFLSSSTTTIPFYDFFEQSISTMDLIPSGMSLKLRLTAGSLLKNPNVNWGVLFFK